MLTIDLLTDNGASNRQDVALNSDAWDWMAVELTGLSNSTTAKLQLMRKNGSIDLDLMIFSSGSILGLNPGEEISLPAPLFFHAGYTDLSKNSVVMRAAYESAEEILYGPHLPLTEGEYQVRMQFTTSAQSGTDLGSISVSCDNVKYGPFPVTAGESAASGSFSTPAKNQPLRFAFKYSRNADIEIQNVIFKRVR